MMNTRFKKNAKIFDIGITAVAGMVCSALRIAGGMARTGTQPLLHRLSGDDMDVFLQPTGHPAVQLLVLRLRGHNGVAARHPLCTASGLLCAAPVVSHAVGVAALHAHLLLCPKELAELYQAKPVGHLHHRHADSCALQLRHLSGALQRIYQLYADGNLDTSHHHLRPRGLLRNGKIK